MALSNEDKQWITEHVTTQIETALQRVTTHVETALERVETRLLTEFHKWAEPTEARARSHASSIHALDLELEALKERVAKLERANESRS